MTARHASQTRDDASLGDDAASANLSWAPRRRRLATVYDAVAGKVSYDQALRDIDTDVAENLQGSHVATGGTQHSANSKGTPYPPDEVLFRRINAPERYAEHDVYFANERDLPDAGRGVLPDSDLLTAVHGYASKFYDAVAKRESRTSAVTARTADERSMDESALLAFGILMEEAGWEVLGRRGDLVFTEDADGSEESDDGNNVTDQAFRGREDRPRSASTSRTPKRRKLTTPDDR